MSGVGVNCTYLNASGTVSVLQDTEILSSTNTPDLSCSISITAPNQNIINTSYYKQVYSSVQVQVDPNITSSPQVENSTDDGSEVSYLRTATTTSDFFVDTVHIESTYLTDLTLATPTKMITLTYTMPEPVQMTGGVENQVVTIFGRIVEFLCEQPVIQPSFLDLFIDTAYAQVNPGKVTCVATTTVTDLDVDNNISGYVIPFSIQNSFDAYLEENLGFTSFSYNISTTTDSSFVRIFKESPLVISPVTTNTNTYVAGIIPIGLTSLTPTTIVPQNIVPESITAQVIKTDIIPEIKVNQEEIVKEVLGLTPEAQNLTSAQIAIIEKNKRRVLGANGLVETGYDSGYNILLGFSLFILAAISVNYIHNSKEKVIN